MSKNLKIKIGVEIDSTKTKMQLDSTLKALQKNKIKIGFDIDTKSLATLKKTLDGFKNIKVNVGTTGTTAKSMSSAVKETNAALNQQKALYSQLKQLQNEEYQIKKKSVGADGEYKKVLTEQLGVIKQKQNAIQQQINTSEKGLASEQKALKLADDKLKKERELAQAKAKVNTEMDRAIQKAIKNMDTSGLNGKQIEEYRRQLESINKVNMKQVREEINSINQAMNNQRITAIDIGNAFKDVGDSLIGFGKGILEVFALPAAGIAYSTKTMADYQYEMAKVEAVADATTIQMAELDAMAKEMGKTTVWSAKESSEALKFMGMAGWSAQEMLQGLPDVLNLATASGESLALTSDIVTDALTAFKLEASDAGRFADVIAQSSSKSNTSVSLMGESFKMCAAISGALGYSIEDTALAIGTMANAGIKSGMAGRSLRQMFTNLAQGVTLTSEEMGEFKYSSMNANGTAKDLGVVLNELRGYFSKMTQEEQVMNAELIGTKTGMSGVLALMNASEDEYNSLADSIANSSGRAKEMSDIMKNNLKGDILLAKSATDQLAISIGETLEPTARSLVQGFTGVINTFSNMDEGTKKLIIGITATGVAFGGLTVAIGMISKASGIAILGFSKLKSGISKIAGKMSGFTSALNLSNGAMLGCVAGAAALAGGLYMIFTHAERADKKLREYNKTLIDNVNTSQENIKSNTSGIKNAKNAMLEIESLEKKLSNTTNADARLKLEGEIINKKQALINLMPEVAKGMDGETTSQHELNNKLQEYIDKKNEAIAIEKMNQKATAREYFSKDENKQANVIETASAQANVKALEKQLDLIAQYDDNTTINGQKVANIRANLENSLAKNSKTLENNLTSMDNFEQMYQILESTGARIPKSIQDQKKLIDEFKAGKIKVEDSVSDVNKEVFGNLESGAKSTIESITELKEAMKEAMNTTDLSDNVIKAFDKINEGLDNNLFTVEEVERAFSNFEKTTTKDFGNFKDTVGGTLDTVMTKFGEGKMTLADFEKATNSLDKYSSESFKNLSDNSKFTMQALAVDLRNGNISVQDFENAINAMSVYATKDFSKLDKASQKTLDKLVSDLPKGGESARILEEAIAGVSARASIDMSKLDKNSQTAVNKIVSAFNEGTITSDIFSEAMSLMSTVSQNGLEKLDKATRDSINTLMREFASGKVTASDFANQLMASMGLAGTSMSNFSAKGQAELINLIGQFLSGTISADKLKEAVANLKSNPEFANTMNTDMGKVQTKSNEAASSVRSVNTEVTNLNGKIADVTINTHKNTYENVFRSGGGGNPITTGSSTQRPIGRNGIPSSGEDNKSVFLSSNSPLESDSTPSVRDKETSESTGNTGGTVNITNPNANSRKTSTTQTDAQREAEEAARKKERMEQDAVNKIQQLRDKLAKALIKKAEEQRDKELKILDEKIKAIEKNYDKEKELLDKQTQKKIQALKDEKEALNGNRTEDYKGKVDALNKELEMWKQNDSAFAKGKVKELEEKLKEAEKDLKNKQIDDEIDRLENEQKEKEKALEERLNKEIEAIEKEKELKEKYWEDKLSDQNIYNEANKILLKGNMNEMIELIKTYAPEWDDLGLLFGENLVDGIKRAMKDALNAKDFMDGKKPEYNETKNPWETSKPNSGGGSSSSNNTQKKGRGKVVGTNSLNVRDGAGTNYKKSGILWRNEQIDIYDEKNGWYYIEYYNAAEKKRKKGWSAGNYIQKFHTGGIIGKMTSDEGIAMVQSGERVLSRTQTSAFEDLVNWLPHFEDIARKFSSLKSNVSNDNSNQNVSINNTFNVYPDSETDTDKLVDNVIKGIENKVRRQGVTMKPNRIFKK